MYSYISDLSNKIVLAARKIDANSFVYCTVNGGMEKIVG